MPYGINIHDCTIGIQLGQKHSDMNPEFLTIHLWWKEPVLVQLENNVLYLESFQRLIFNLPHNFEIPTPEVEVVDLD